MNKYNQYEILLKNKKNISGKMICEIIPDLFGKPIASTYGYFLLQEIFLDCNVLLNYIVDYEKTLGTNRCKKLEKLCQDEIRSEKKIMKNLTEEHGQKDYLKTPISLSGMELEQTLQIKTKDLGLALVTPHPESLESSIVHAYLFTKKLLKMKGGRLDEGLNADIKNAKKFYETILELREWETNKLWESAWEPFGGIPSEKELEKIPDDKIPFEFEEIDWSWGWEDSKGETIMGYTIDLRDIIVHPRETLEELERRIDQSINPIKEYLSKIKPSLSSWWEP